MKMMTFDDVLAGVLNTSRVTANRMIARGEFVQPYQVAGKLLFSEDEVVEWLSKQPRGLYPEPDSLRKSRAGKRAGGAK